MEIERFRHSIRNIDRTIQTKLVQNKDTSIDYYLEKIEDMEIESKDTSIDTQTNLSELKVSLSMELTSHLNRLGYKIIDGCLEKRLNLPKAELRKMQSDKKKEILRRNIHFLKSKSKKLIEYVANGEDVDPEQIDIELVEVKRSTLESDLFRFLTYYWSVPVSQGYGRRMRFLVKDKQNQKIVGLFALTDPVFNLRVRDQWIGWDVSQRRENLRSVMDVFVLGAIPPYSLILGGKLVCIQTTSNFVREVYRKKYRNMTSVISQRRHDNDLLMLTTTSALGKSSLYDRVKLNDRKYFIPVGNTCGYGHFHIPQYLFTKMRKLLELIEHPYTKENRFGHGPNWRMRVIRRALQECGFHHKILQHHIQRETYVIPLASNTRKCLLGKNKRGKFFNEDVQDLTANALKRWVIPRSERRGEYKVFEKWQILDSIIEYMGEKNDSER